MRGEGRVPVALFARAAIPGRSKTRLARAIGDDAAAALYAAFLDDAVSMISRVARAAPELWAASDADAKWLHDRYPQFHCREQSGTDLGARMRAALDDGIARAGAAIVLGTDAPTLPPEHVDAAIEALARADVVLGPADDGGYWAIGARDRAPDLTGVRWSSAHALADTRARLAGRRVELVASWYDVDEAADLTRLRADLDRAPATRVALASFDPA